MKTYSVNTWEEVKEAFKIIEQDRLELARNLGFSLHLSPFLFRGQGNSDWKLKTTLERVVEKPVSVIQYYRHVLKTQHQVEAFSNTQWKLKNLDECTAWVESRTDLNWPDFPGYDYMIYLRHHGFPSPLLDWTRSPYVAAYFAYTSLPREGESVVIYCYTDTISGGKGWSSAVPNISVKGPYVRSHKRHFIQQCEYTVCSKLSDNILYFGDHEETFELDKSGQDLLWKIIVPRSTATIALKDLDLMNVNALSLMGSEDALVETLGVREYLLNDD